MVSEIKFGKLRFCRICGKQGVKFASDGCKYCGSPWISDAVWEVKKREGLTEGNVLKKEGSKKLVVETVSHISKKTGSAIAPFIFWPLLVVLIGLIWILIIAYLD